MREKEEEERRARRERERQARWLMRQIERGQSLLLSAVQNLRMWSWSVVEKFSLNCLLISISGNGTWIELGGWQNGKKIEVFIF